MRTRSSIHLLSVLFATCALQVATNEDDSSCSFDLMKACRSSVSAVMKAVRVSEFGGVSVLKMKEDVIIPSPGPNEVQRDAVYRLD